MKIYPFLCRNASYCFMFCADRTDRQSTRKRSKKSFPHSLSIFTIRCHTSMPKNGHGSDDPCAERTELGRNRQHPRRWPLPYCCCMVPSRQKTLSIPAPYRCHIRPMPDHSNCDLDTTQKKTAPSSDGAVSHTSYSRSAMIDPAAVHHTRSCAAKPIRTSFSTAPYARPVIPIPPAAQFHPSKRRSPSSVPISCHTLAMLMHARIGRTSPIGADYTPQTKRKTFRTSCRRSFRCWHLSIVPGRFQPSIVDTSELNCRVRDGNGCTLTVIDTNYLRLPPPISAPLITGRYPEN